MGSSGEIKGPGVETSPSAGACGVTGGGSGLEDSPSAGAGIGPEPTVEPVAGGVGTGVSCCSFIVFDLS